MVNTVWGTVCLLRNSAGDGIDTYRISKTDWAGLSVSSTNEDTLATNIKAVGGALQDKTAVDGSGDPTKVDWMDYYHCKATTSNTHWTCAAFQPENNSSDLSQGYPRFGHLESQASFTKFVMLTGVSSTASEDSWTIYYDGAQALLGIVAVGAYLLAF